MKASELRELSREDLDAEVGKLREKLFKFRFNATNDEMQRAGEIRQARRDIARVKTVIREQQLAAAKKEKTDDDA